MMRTFSITLTKVETMGEAKLVAKSVMLAIAAALTVGTVGGVGAAKANDHDDHGRERGGFVIACSLDGVNPAFHPEVFANAATARSMGFFQSPDGVWHVLPGCRR
jgi:hypothetical protein